MAKEFSVRADGFTAIFSLAPLLLMSLSGMIVQDTQPTSLLLPLPSLPDESEAAAPASAFAQLLNMFLPPPPAAQIAPPAPPDSAPSAAFSMLPSAAPAPASDPAKFIGAEVIRLDEKSLSIRDLPELPISELSGFTIAESASTTPTLAGPVIETSQVAARVARSQATGDTHSSDAVDAAPVTMARRPRRDGEPPANDLAETGWAGTPQMTLTQPPIGVSSPAIFQASTKSELTTDMRQSASPLSQSARLDGGAMARSPIIDMPPAFASETATAAESQSLGLLNQANDDLTTKQPVELPIAARKAPARSDDRDSSNDLAETGWAGTPQMTLTQAPIGVSSAAIFQASAKSELSTDMRQSASPLSKSAGLDGSALPRSPMVDMPPAPASETATAAESQSLGLLNQANDDLTTKQPVELPIVARKAPARSDDRDSSKAPSLRTEDHASMAVNDSSIANATAAQRQSDGMRHFPFTERTLEIDPEPNPETSRSVRATPVNQDAEKSQAGMAAAAPGDEHSAAKDGWQGQPRDSAAQANPSMVAGAAPAWIDESHRGEAAAPAWRPMVERLARDIGEHFRVGEQQAVLQLEPPELGKVTIDLRIEDGQLHVRIAADGQESQGLIENHLSELRQALRAGPIEVADLRVTQGEWQGSTGLAQNFNQSPHGRQEAPRAFAGFAGRDETVAEHPPQPQRSANGRVSMWA